MKNEEKMNLILDLLGVSNAAIAKISDVDPSLVSRYRSGTRKPSSSSKQLIKICNGIASYAVNKKLWDKLSRKCLFPNTNTPADAILQFLTTTDTSYPQEDASNNVSISTIGMSFGEKLKLLMEVLDLSNIKLARAMNVDTSLISRMKSGERVPKDNSILLTSMCYYLQKQIKIKKLSNEISTLFQISIDTFTIDEDASVQILSEWMLSHNEPTAKKAVNNFISKLVTLDTYSPSVNTPELDVTSLPRIENTSSCYFGISGFRDALITLFHKICSSSKTHTIKIYSDQNMDWLSNSMRSFSDTFSHFANQVLVKQNRYKIIHNIERDINEMLLCIEKWLPFYHSGLAEGFYCPTTSYARFSHTLVVVPDLAVIYSTNIIGTENSGKYNYSEKPDDLCFFDQQFEALILKSKPLAQVFVRPFINNYILLQNKMSVESGAIKRMISAPSIHTMPTDLFKRIISRASSINQSDIQKCIEQHSVLVTQFENMLKNSSILDYIYFPAPEEFTSGSVAVNLSDLFIEETITYRFDEFSEHITHIISLLQNQNYNIIPLTGASNNAPCIIIKDPSEASIIFHNSTAFRFKHQYLCHAFDEYIEAQTNNCRLPLNTKDEILHYLRRYSHNYK